MRAVSRAVPRVRLAQLAMYGLRQGASSILATAIDLYRWQRNRARAKAGLGDEVSYGSNRPARYDSTREKARLLRMQLVRQVGCVVGRDIAFADQRPETHSCLRDAIETVSDREYMAGEWQRRVRVPRSLRRFAK
jgi:hypothetical protein